MYSEARTVDEYLTALPDGRREDISKVRDVILGNLPQGYAEAMSWGMITYQVPLEVYPDTYNGKPLMYAALASQKDYMALYIMSIYMSAESRKQFEAEDFVDRTKKTRSQRKGGVSADECRRA